MRRLAALAAAALGAMVAPASAADNLDAAIGKAVFDRLWVQAPASTANADGLGPLFAARACASCHAGVAGRTRFRLGRDDPGAHPGLVTRFGSATGAPDPVYGAELQPEGVGNVSGEGRALVAFADGTGKPNWRIEQPGYGQIAPDTRLSARVAPSLAGLGKVERVAEAAILNLADPDDRDGDGVSGRPHWIETPDERRLGRFGWKASEPTLRAQAAAAFTLDLGLSTTVRRDPAGDCTPSQTACRAAPQGASGAAPEVAEVLLASLVTFLERRPATVSEAPPKRGAKLFARIGCSACHVPTLPLENGAAIAPYTDLLLHDMGPGLDDGVGEGGAASVEWRTAPLWGLSRSLAQGSGLLHDGRAANVDQAVRWHGGEASAARKRYDALSASDRNALIKFVNRL